MLNRGLVLKAGTMSYKITKKEPYHEEEQSRVFTD